MRTCPDRAAAPLTPHRHWWGTRSWRPSASQWPPMRFASRRKTRKFFVTDKGGNQKMGRIVVAFLQHEDFIFSRTGRRRGGARRRSARTLPKFGPSSPRSALLDGPQPTRVEFSTPSACPRSGKARRWRFSTTFPSVPTSLPPAACVPDTHSCAHDGSGNDPGRQADGTPRPVPLSESGGACGADGMWKRFRERSCPAKGNALRFISARILAIPSPAATAPAKGRKGRCAGAPVSPGGSGSLERGLA